MSEEQKLPRPEPCPFCGVRKVWLNQDVATGEWFVRCKACLGTGPLGPDPLRALGVWNTRPGEIAAELRSGIIGENGSYSK